MAMNWAALEPNLNGIPSPKLCPNTTDSGELQVISGTVPGAHIT